MDQAFILMAEYPDGRREVLSTFRGRDAEKRARSYAKMIALPDKGRVDVIEGRREP